MAARELISESRGLQLELVSPLGACRAQIKTEEEEEEELPAGGPRGRPRLSLASALALAGNVYM